MWTFGDGDFGSLGLNDEQSRLVPTLLAAEVFDGSKIVTVAAGCAYRCGGGGRGRGPGASPGVPVHGACTRPGPRLALAVYRGACTRMRCCKSAKTCTRGWVREKRGREEERERELYETYDEMLQDVHQRLRERERERKRESAAATSAPPLHLFNTNTHYSSSSSVGVARSLPESTSRFLL